MKYQKGFMGVLVVLVVVAVLAAAGFVIYTRAQKKNVSVVPAQFQGQYQQSAGSVAPINNASDLNSASTSLDSTDTTQLDTQLNQLNTSSSSF